MSQRRLEGLRRLIRVLSAHARGIPLKAIARMEGKTPRWIEKLIRYHVKKIQFVFPSKS